MHIYIYIYIRVSKKFCMNEWYIKLECTMSDLIIINLSQATRLSNSQQKKRTCQIVDFAIPTDQRVKLKEIKTGDKYVDLARELKKLRNMKVTEIPVVIGALGVVTKGYVQELEYLEISSSVEIIQKTALLRSSRIPRQVLETWEDLLSLKFWRKIIS